MKDDKLYLIHILECIERIERYTAGGNSFFLNDTKTQDAVTRNLQILAESAQRISHSLKIAHDEVDWRSISAFRNVIVHDYLGIDVQRIWDIVEQDLHDLKNKIRAILNKAGGVSQN